ncbi:unnamed protein product [Paramecium sonneborni]|uniref:WD40-repeat-containing domain n=1 Tax=Paramecium sonneborni TaxID=65129 RepID=A0A8S1RMT4_9CILI|nr:unnamed protein product [Paramecium sonneborni]
MDELQCQLHFSPIMFIETSPKKSSSRLKCKNCEEVEKGVPLIAINRFDSHCQEQKIKIQKEQESVIADFQQFSDPLKKLLDNYQLEINSTIKRIRLELHIIFDSIHQFYNPIINYDPQQKSMSNLQQTSDLIYDSTCKFNLKPKYFEVIKVMKTLFGLQHHYSQIMKKCFEQLQNDLAKYELSSEFKVSPSKICNAIAFSPDKDGQIVSLGLGNILQTYQYIKQQDNQNFNLLQTFKDHENYISCILFSEDKKYLISGGTYDKRMNIYTESKNKNHFYQLIAQVIHQDAINSIIFTTNNEDIISTSGHDIYRISNEDIEEILNQNKGQEIKKINLNQDLNKYQLNPSHDNTAYQLSYMFTTNLKQFLSCSFDKQVFVWQKQKDFWNMNNRIKMLNHIYRCCFINENDIVIQENSSRELSFYENVSRKNDFKKSKIKQVKFEDLNTDLTCSFPIVFIQKLKLLVVKHNKKIVFLKERTDGKFYKENEIEGEMGAISPDGDIFLKWNKKQSNLELFKLNSGIKFKKEEFEKRYLPPQDIIIQDFDDQQLYNQKGPQQINLIDPNSEHLNENSQVLLKREIEIQKEDESTKQNLREEKKSEENKIEDQNLSEVDETCNLVKFID